ncbi:YfiT family bacillithiol transferase [Deinococcus pimensis]|uniref:YfiT family bacillithiol transferase n=1 Tax=Deinococcus pimensis TaxID=309888 RepID=UPI00048676E1|nr:putative metal-dependent hydrolase [Deinococcus pimensis]
MNDVRFPIGPFLPATYDAPARAALILDLATLPERLRAAVRDLDDDRLDTPYREGGWTVRQVVHHVADSHMNAYVRVKLALTEDHPTVRPYDEAAWASLPDSRLPVDVSLSLLGALHERWAALWRDLPGEAWARTFHHPASGETVRLDTALAQYAWHGRHHLAHVTALSEREGWTARNVP